MDQCCIYTTELCQLYARWLRIIMCLNEQTKDGSTLNNFVDIRGRPICWCVEFMSGVQKFGILLPHQNQQGILFFGKFSQN